MRTHELAQLLLTAEDYEVEASIDISTCDADSDRRIFTNEFIGINNLSGDGRAIVLLFSANNTDNFGKEF